MKITTKTYWIRLAPRVAKALKEQARLERMSRASYMAKCLEAVVALKGGAEQ